MTVPPLLAEAANGHVHVMLRAAPAVTLHDAQFWRADGNSPVRVERGGVTVFFSDYEPRGGAFVGAAAWRCASRRKRSLFISSTTRTRWSASGSKPSGGTRPTACCVAGTMPRRWAVPGAPPCAAYR